jgi:Tfp pilus assembly protein PilV
VSGTLSAFKGGLMDIFYTMQKERTGSILLEVVISVAILAIVLSGLTGLVLQGKELSSLAGSRYKAIVLARNQIEKARNTDFDLISGLAETEVVMDQFGETDADGIFRRTTTVDSVSENLVEVTVLVELMSRRTLDFTVHGEELQTYIAWYKEPEE